MLDGEVVWCGWAYWMCGGSIKGREFVALLSDEGEVVGVVKVEDVVGEWD